MAFDLLHEACPLGNEPQTILQRHDAGNAGCDILTHTMAQHNVGLDAPRFPQIGQGVLEGKQGGLCVVCLMEQRLSLILRFDCRIKDRQQRFSPMFPQDLVATIQCGAEARMGLIELTSHVHLLRTLARKQKCYLGPSQRADGTSLDGSRPRFFRHPWQEFAQLLQVGGGNCESMIKVDAASVQGVSQIGKFSIGMLLEMVCQLFGLTKNGRFLLARQFEQVDRSRCRRVGWDDPWRSFFHNQMGIRPPKAKRADPGDPRSVRFGPRRSLAWHLDPRTGQINVTIQFFKMSLGRNLMMMQHEPYFDQTSDTGDSLHMPDICLHTGNVTWPNLLVASSKDFTEGLYFDRIAQGSTSPVSLDITDFVGYQLCLRKGRLNAGLLGLAVGSTNPGSTAILVDRGCSQHRPNLIVVAQRILQTLEHYQSTTLAPNVTIGIGVEGSTPPVRRQHAGLGKSNRRFGCKNSIHTASDCSVALPPTQTLDS